MTLLSPSAPGPAVEPPSETVASRVRIAAAYALMIVAGIALFALIREAGSGIRAPERSPAAEGPSAARKLDVLPRVLLALAVVILLSRAIGLAFRRIQQPRVIGEVVAGILLGPSVLGQVSPEAFAFAFPPSVVPLLGILAQVGIVLFMFLVGLELDPAVLRARSHSTLAISHASIVVPFVLGAGLALWLYPRFSSSDVPFDVFALFLGVSMSVTAFPVLARILTDRGMQGTRLGTIAITCAAVDDVTAWCLLASIVSLVQAEARGASATIALTALYVAAIFFVVRPIVKRYVAFQGDREVRQGVVAGAILLLLLSALATEAIGIHAFFGAFLLGAIVPPHSALSEQLRAKIEDVTVVLLLPAFFAYTGLRTQLGLVSGFESWLVCALIVCVACAGKFGGSFVAARLTGLGWRDAAAIGVLMNTRGLVELIVLNVGLDLGVLSPALFAMLVVMALVTTFATSPILSWIQRGSAPT